MDFTALLNVGLQLVLMGTVCSRPQCKPDCEFTTKYHEPDFKHVSELQHSSVAPWKMSTNIAEDREPTYIEYADCHNCTVEDMIAKPIILQVSIYERIRNDTGIAWCKCPFNLAVGCTCVKKQ